MPHIKTDIKKSGTYIRIIGSKRGADGKVKKTTIHNLGNVANYSQTSLKKIGKVFYELGGGSIPEEKKPNITEIARYNHGFMAVYDRILKEYELDKYFRRLAKRYHIEFDIYQTLLLMLVERLSEPSSKLSNYNHQHEYLGIKNIELHNLYRTLDYLSDNQSMVQKLIYNKGRNLFNQELDVVFYDVTTFYFHSNREDGFRKKGFDKDNKIGKTSIVFGMLIDKDKNPIGYRIYKGGQYEGHTFADAVKKLKEEYKISKVIAVADRGMMNAENIRFLSSASIGYEYIIGERLKNLPKSVQESILDRSKYMKLSLQDSENDEDMAIEYYTFEHQGKRIITTYSEKRARKDRFEREERIRKGKELLNTPSNVEKKAASYYLKKTSKSVYVLDEEKIKNNERYDGFISISTNAVELSENQVLEAYKQLYKIEHTFRTFKSYLEARPMYHWTERRIEGHLCLCYICFTLLNYLQQELARKKKAMSEKKIREVLGKAQLSLINLEGEEYYLSSKIEDGVRMIYKLLRIKELPNLIPKDDITKYISIG